MTSRRDPPNTPPGRHQLALDLPHEPASGLDDFIRGAANAVALDFVLSWPEWPSPAAILTGPAGAGKSHLARIWADRSGALVVPAGDPRLGDLVREPGQRLVIEDADTRKADETALFHLFNHTVETGGAVLFTARMAPAQWRIGLADLASRLRAATLIEISAPDERLLEAVLVKQFADRQLEVGTGVILFILNRMERSLDTARELVARLDRRSLEEGQRVTSRLAAQVLAEMEEREAGLGRG